jgi:hypothetical protein
MNIIKGGSPMTMRITLSWILSIRLKNKKKVSGGNMPPEIIKVK